MKTQKFYTVSTKIFKTKKEAEKQLLKWDQEEGLQEGSIIFEVTKMWKPEVRKVVRFSSYKHKL